MPLRDYHCNKCDRTEEYLEASDYRGVRRCAGCGRTMAKKVPTANFQLKGGGWYKDGYSKKS